MEPDRELDAWRQEWQAQEMVPPDLRHRVERETHGARRVRRAEIGLTVIMAGGMLYWTLASGARRNVMAVAIAVAILLVIAWILEFSIGRNVWKPSAETTAAYLDLSIRRCRAALSSLIPQAVLYALGWTVNIVLLFGVRPRSLAELWEFIVSPPALVLWLVTAILAVVAVRHARKLHRELDILRQLRRELRDG